MSTVVNGMVKQPRIGIALSEAQHNAIIHNISLFRQKHGLTPYAFITSSNVSNQTYYAKIAKPGSKWQPQTKTLNSLAEALGVTGEQLLTELTPGYFESSEHKAKKLKKIAKLAKSSKPTKETPSYAKTLDKIPKTNKSVAKEVKVDSNQGLQALVNISVPGGNVIVGTSCLSMATYDKKNNVLHLRLD